MFGLVSLLSIGSRAQQQVSVRMVKEIVNLERDQS
jgi:hypothetical protein